MFDIIFGPLQSYFSLGVTLFYWLDNNFHLLKRGRNKHRLQLWGTKIISFKAYSRQRIKKRGDENIFLNSLTRKDPFINIIGNKINFPKSVKLPTK